MRGERFALIGSVVAASAAVAVGVFLSLLTTHAHWMNRAGAAVVVLQVLAVIGEYLRRSRLRQIQPYLIRARDKNGNQRRESSHDETRRRVYVQEEIERSERQALVIVLLLAAAGEVLHGFGDLLFEMLAH